MKCVRMVIKHWEGDHILSEHVCDRVHYGLDLNNGGENVAITSDFFGGVEKTIPVKNIELMYLREEDV